MSITPEYTFGYVPTLGQRFDQFGSNDFATGFSEPTEQNWIPAPTVCRFFLSGNCRYGEFCRNSHTLPEGAANSSAGSEQEDANNNHYTNEGTRNWIDAPEFVPRYISENTHQTSLSTEDEEDAASSNNTSTISYAQIVSGKLYNDHGVEVYSTDGQCSLPLEYMASTLCPYIQSIITKPDGTISCKYGDRCPYQHGDLCDICSLYCLHPTDQNQRKAHEKECMTIMEKDMEHSFAMARSKDKTCGICFEVITEKAQRGEHRFGILPNCNHIFCLPCIGKWRQAKNFDSTITRACPECRVESHYVCPSLYWVDTKEEKDKLLGEYKDALQQRNCKYFNRGEGTCPFGNKCFYKHALPSGELVDVGIPQQRRRYDLHGELTTTEQVILWNFLQSREVFSDEDDISWFSDSDDSD